MLSVRDSGKRRKGWAYSAYALWVVVVSMNREDRCADVEIPIFVVYSGKADVAI